jgi:Raf kinase inhibitor-like YbhB/YbcL family protein
MTIRIISDVFEYGALIPETHTCDDINISPPLSWSTLPEHTISFTIICEDPDAPRGTFTHWIIFNIPANVHELPKAVKKEERLENNAIQGINDFGYIGYGGPCPPEGPEHRFYFRIYALDSTLNLNPGVRRQDLMDAMWGRVLDEGELMGKYGR